MRQESIAKPEFRGPEIPAGHLIFIPFMPLKKIISDLRKKASQKVLLHQSELFYFKDRAVLYGPVGASASVSTLEKIRLGNLKEIIVLSYCGSLSEQLEIGQAFLPLSALSDEGTSNHYLPRKDKLYQLQTGSRQQLVDYLTTRDLPYAQGTIVSTDAPYRETAAWLIKVQKKRVVAVDMELAAVLAFSEFYGIEAAGLFIVSDQLSPSSWHNLMGSQRVKSATENYFLPLIFEP
ncbi:MAG TPA: nucleoside phosphorylase [Candidatus Saccharicenans sp.]|jgi:purine-nucleoside phosphorylase|nr:nucleoside phosphorylase [Candidatus Saccharicenans sp.]HRD02675.1 nucleoside phosphorylase [Candidatus Saccharicenans sp.]